MLSKLKRYVRHGFKLSLVEESSSKLNTTLDRLEAISTSLREHQDNSNRGIENLRLALGRIEARQLSTIGSKNIQDYEFKVFSQWGEDGIIQFIINSIPSIQKTFIEFGASDYIESNTRFLLINNNWSGLVIDGSQKNIDMIKNSELYWRYDLSAVCAFINKDNINQIIKKSGFSGEVGILSIDIDGNDYWVWQAIDTVAPQVVIVEYNSRFGDEKAVTIPYSKSFERSKAHYSMLYAGASLKAMVGLAAKKGYFFVGTSSGGNNAFFVRNDLKNTNLKSLSAKQGFTSGKFREARNRDGSLSYISPLEEQKILNSLPLIDVENEIRVRNRQ